VVGIFVTRHTHCGSATAFDRIVVRFLHHILYGHILFVLVEIIEAAIVVISLFAIFGAFKGKSRHASKRLRALAQARGGCWFYLQWSDGRQREDRKRRLASDDSRRQTSQIPRNPRE